MNQLSAADVVAFQNYIWRFFDRAGRSDLPWRQNYDPYQIMVSEIMLQQTQVDRVVPKYLKFLERFPTVELLAEAPVAAVIRQWQGLGYNRRGLNLQKAAQQIVAEFDGQVPKRTEDLVSLAGIGPYTAAAIQAFAYDQPSIVIETNIRTVFLFHFFHEAYLVEDKELLALIAATLPREKPRKWYSALMDYGAYLKKNVPNPTRKSKSYAKQSKFAGSNRQLRGAILRAATAANELTYPKLQEQLSVSSDKLDLALEQLAAEGFIVYDQQRIRLAE